MLTPRYILAVVRVLFVVLGAGLIASCSSSGVDDGVADSVGQGSSSSVVSGDVPATTVAVDDDAPGVVSVSSDLCSSLSRLLSSLSVGTTDLSQMHSVSLNLAMFAADVDAPKEEADVVWDAARQLQAAIWSEASVEGQTLDETRQSLADMHDEEALRESMTALEGLAVEWCG